MNRTRSVVGLRGREQFGAWREGTHDDLVLAVALGCGAARKLYPGEPAGEEAYWRHKSWSDCERDFRREMERRRKKGGEGGQAEGSD